MLSIMNSEVTYLRQMGYVRNYPRVISRTEHINTTSNSPEMIEMLTYRANALAALHRDDEAVETYTRIIGLNGQTAQIYLDKGLLEINLGRFVEAAASLHEVLRLETENLHALDALVHIAESCHQWQDLLLLTEKCLAIAPDEVGFLLARADAFRHLGQWQQAIETGRQALVHAADDEDLSMIHTHLGWTYSSMKDWSRAERELRLALEAYDEFADSHFLLGLSLAESGKVAAGLEAAERSFQFDPDNAYAYKVRAIILLKMGQREKAIADLRQARELDYRLDYDDEVDVLLQRLLQ
ncbi:MAG: tetratricopeptide repeat protein [Lewinella sp.]